MEELNPLIQSEWEYLESKNGEWSLLEGEQDMEVLEHVLRCILHMDLTEKRPLEFQECVKVQTLMAAGRKNRTPKSPPCGSPLLLD